MLERGAHPYTTIGLEGLGEIFFKYASDAQLDYVPNVERQLVEDANARISVWTEVNTKAFTNIDPARQARAGRRADHSCSASWNVRPRKS